MDFFCVAGGDQQAEQSKNLAEGQNPIAREAPELPTRARDTHRSMDQGWMCATTPAQPGGGPWHGACKAPELPARARSTRLAPGMDVCNYACPARRWSMARCMPGTRAACTNQEHKLVGLANPKWPTLQIGVQAVGTGLRNGERESESCLQGRVDTLEFRGRKWESLPARAGSTQWEVWGEIVPICCVVRTPKTWSLTRKGD
eukprot:1156990-Pelagomonas_calceolata.AAC.1